jgi:hypothetical protein
MPKMNPEQQIPAKHSPVADCNNGIDRTANANIKTTAISSQLPSKWLTA